MPKTGKSVKQNLTLIKGNSGSWEDAIKKAELLLIANRVRAKQLKLAIQTFKERLASGDPWPGQSTQN